MSMHISNIGSKSSNISTVFAVGGPDLCAIPGCIKNSRITSVRVKLSSSFETVKQFASRSNILEGFSTKGGIDRDGILFVMEGEKEKQVQIDVQNWLKKIGLYK